MKNELAVEEQKITVTTQKVLTEAQWKKAENAFYKQIEVGRSGAIHNLRTGILAALQELTK